MAPSEPGALLSRVHVLLAHYRERDQPVQVEAALAEDWLDDLSEFPIWAVLEATRRWRRHPTKFRYRPLPGDIRALCIDVVGRLPTVADRLRKLLKSASATREDSPAHDIRSRVIALAALKPMP